MKELIMNWFKKKEKPCEHVYFAVLNSVSHIEDIKRTGIAHFHFLLTCGKCGAPIDETITIQRVRQFDNLNYLVEFYKTTVLMRLAGKYKIMNKIDF